MNEINQFTGSYSFLSNFYPMPFIVEARYQAAKTLNSADQAEILASETGAIAKAYGSGRRLLGRDTFTPHRLELRPDWNKLRIPVMRPLIDEKFNDPMVQVWLMETEDAYIREGNYWGDRFWGAVWSLNSKQWEGSNILGHLIMEKRAHLKGADYEFPKID